MAEVKHLGLSCLTSNEVSDHSMVGRGCCSYLLVHCKIPEAEKRGLHYTVCFWGQNNNNNNNNNYNYNLICLLLYCRNKGVAAFLGSEMWEQLGRYETEPPGECGTVFRSTCPWDSRGITSIVMKLMVRRKLSLVVIKEFCYNFLFAIMQSYFLS